MNVSRSPISCSSSSDGLYNAPSTIALNISTVSHGLRPAADFRSRLGLRHTASSTGRKSSQGTSSSIITRCLPRFASSFRLRPSAATSAKLNCPGPRVRAISRSRPQTQLAHQSCEHSNIARSEPTVTPSPNPVRFAPDAFGHLSRCPIVAGRGRRASGNSRFDRGS